MLVDYEIIHLLKLEYTQIIHTLDDLSQPLTRLQIYEIKYKITEISNK